MTFQEKKKAITDCMLNEDDLDGIVHDMASLTASKVNNGGIDSQLTYLFQMGMTVEEIREATV